MYKRQVVLEKDFWVCWLLGVLFESRFADALVFKGGTSLSKVFGVIDRFSEDIDLSVSPGFLQLPSLEVGASRNKANKWMKAAEAACGTAVEEQIAPALEAAVRPVLGERDGGWFEFLTDPGTDSGTEPAEESPWPIGHPRRPWLATPRLAACPPCQKGEDPGRRVVPGLSFPLSKTLQNQNEASDSYCMMTWILLTLKPKPV